MMPPRPRFQYALIAILAALQAPRPALAQEAHASSGCSQSALVSTGGNGYHYCFAADAGTGLSHPDAGRAGEILAETAIGRLPAGRHRVRWDGRGPSGRPLPGGFYLLRILRG